MKLLRSAVSLLVAMLVATSLPSAPALFFSASDSASQEPGADRRPPELWEPPLGHPLEVGAAFSLPNGPYRAGHRGVDLLAGAGPGASEAPQVRAPASGIVTFVGTVVDRPVVSIRVDDRTVLSMEPVESTLQAGDSVSRGEVIGEAVEGHCTTLCVHLGVRVDGAYVNPLRFLRPRPVLLPW